MFTKLGMNEDKDVYLFACTAPKQPYPSILYMHALSKCPYLYRQNAHSAIKETRGKSWESLKKVWTSKWDKKTRVYSVRSQVGFSQDLYIELLVLSLKLPFCPLLLAPSWKAEMLSLTLSLSLSTFNSNLFLYIGCLHHKTLSF